MTTIAILGGTGAPVESREVETLRWRDGQAAAGARMLAEEVAVALTYNASTHAVMLATPADLEDFAVGFSLAEGVVAALGEIEGIEVVVAPAGIELRLWLAPARAASMAHRRRHLAGATGCGLCGLDSLSEAIRPLPRVPAGSIVTPAQVAAAMAALAPAQSLNHETRAVHAAGFWDLRDGLILVREDVGRHNALDKLAGALARRGLSADRGLVLLTSRVSVEMVQKAAFMGAPIVVAVSAPTGLAVRSAEAAGITLVAVARADGFEVFTHARRIASS